MSKVNGIEIEYEKTTQEKLLDHLLGEVDDALACQLIFEGGQMLAGGVKKGPIPGTYLICTPVLDKRGQPAGMTDLYFLGRVVIGVQIPTEPGRIVAPGPRGIVTEV